jgi:integrase
MPRAPKNTVSFTNRALQAVKPGETRIDYMDSTLEGFGLRVFPSGHKTLFVRYRFGRGFRRFTLGEFPRLTLASARAQALDVLARVARGEDPQNGRHEQRTATTFAELAHSYLALHAKPRMTNRTYHEEERIIKADLLPRWRRLEAQEIRRRDVAQLLDAIIARGARVQANRTRAAARRVFKFAVQREIIEANPVADLDRPSQEVSRQRVLSEDEIRILWTTWEAEGSVTSALLRFMLLTGQRKQEIVSLRWVDVHGAWWTIPAGVVKNKLAHRVFLSVEALQLLAALKESTGASEWVFASPRKQGKPLSWVNKAKERFREATGIADWRPHDLRRTAATYMGRMGISRAVIARVLNHAEKGVTAIYDRSTGESDIEFALVRWGERLTEIIREPGMKLTA